MGIHRNLNDDTSPRSGCLIFLIIMIAIGLMLIYASQMGGK